MNKVVLVTNMGSITVHLHDDMPITAGNFKNLVKQGIYDGVLFYRVEHGFVIQAGPEGSGRDASIPTIRDEFTSHNRNSRGTIAMAKTDQPNSASSEFYINLVDNNRLDSNYSVFGEVTSGMDTVDKIGRVETVLDEATRMHKPLQEVKIAKAELIR
ncbi:peptidylprolyl isomerase [Candidatus Bathyarchaeota archaeon]|nr:peptidylprolyl isomerase [Candidatus Bathyarchaeota archaeon]